MSTYSVYNIHIDNNLSFTPGATAGSVLAIDANGNTSWVPQSGGSGGFNWRGEWDVNLAYFVDDAVSYLGGSYICIANIPFGSGTPPEAPGNWSPIAAQTLQQTLALGNDVGTYSIVGVTISISSSEKTEIKAGGYSTIILTDDSVYGADRIHMETYKFDMTLDDGMYFTLMPNWSFGESKLLSIDGDGKVIATSSTGGGSQTLEQTLALGNDVGTYSIVSSPGQQLNINAGEGSSVRIDGGASANYIGVGYGSIVLSGTSSFSGDVVIPSITNSFLATDSEGKIIATASPGGGSSFGSFGITIDGGGSAITTGVKGYVQVPYSGTITGWTLLADVSGSIVIDVWKDIYMNFPPLVADSIAGSEKPTLSSAQKNENNALSTWITSVSAGDIIAFNVDSASTLTRVNLAINITKS